MTLDVHAQIRNAFGNPAGPPQRHAAIEVGLVQGVVEGDGPVEVLYGRIELVQLHIG
jgi:hypothetical protein